jgi:hypothetical protein
VISQRSFRATSWCLLVLAVGACGTSDNPGKLVTRDSAGVAILTYPAAAWDSAPAWTLSEKPLMMLGGDSVDATMDLSTTIAAQLLPDGRSVVSTSNPAEVMLFDLNGRREARLASAGSGPGEFRAISQFVSLGGDTLLAFDPVQRKGLLFAGNGMPLGELPLPPINATNAPTLRGRLADGTFVFTVDEGAVSPPSGTAGPFRAPMVVLGLRGNGSRYDTLTKSMGPELVPATMMVGGQPTPVSKPLIFGATTQVAVGGSQWFLCTTERMEIETHDSQGKLRRVVRLSLPERKVLVGDQEKYKATVREAYDRVKGMMSPEMFATELKKIDETTFADHLPRVAQLLTDREGNLWVNRGFSLLDKFRSWAIFNPEGRLIGHAETPIGSVLSISTDRVLIRREDPQTRRVGVELYALTRSGGGAAPADSSRK